jgi:hypothetical protein
VTVVVVERFGQLDAALNAGIEGRMAPEVYLRAKGITPPKYKC